MPDALIERDGAVLIMTMNRPKRLNALSGAMLIRMLDAMQAADVDDDVRAIILTGAKGNCASGAGGGAMAGGAGEDADTEIDVQARLAADPDLMWKCLLRHYQPKKPLIAAVEGIAFAGGTELLQGTDIRVAGRTARFAVSEVKRSLYPMAGSAVRLRRQIPYTIAAEVLLAGRELTADEALQYGLVGHVVDEGQALNKALEIAQQIAANGPIAVEAVLRTLRETEGMTEREALDHEFSYGQAVFATEDAKEGPLAFKEKRTPVYKRR